MIDAAAIRETISLYRKHGWTLRRVLLSMPTSKSLLTDPADLFGDVTVIESELDAAWFSRSSRPECTAWEIRHLSEVPFALVEVIEDSSDSEQSNEIFANAEAKMREIVRKTLQAN